jgi:hypothetical protein
MHNDGIFSPEIFITDCLLFLAAKQEKDMNTNKKWEKL